MIKVYCNRCGEEIHMGAMVGRVSLSTKNSIFDKESFVNEEVKGMHFCKECMLSIIGFICSSKDDSEDYTQDLETEEVHEEKESIVLSENHKSKDTVCGNTENNLSNKQSVKGTSETKTTGTQGWKDDVPDDDASYVDYDRRRHRRGSIDYGKIIALRNANWKLKAIAEECNCSMSTVQNVLKAVKENSKNSS